MVSGGQGMQGLGYRGRVYVGVGILGVGYPEGGYQGGYFGGWHASYWNAFLFGFCNHIVKFSEIYFGESYDDIVIVVGFNVLYSLAHFNSFFFFSTSN